MGMQWINLNLSGTIILIKSILFYLTIYQCYGLLAPKGIKEKIGILLRKEKIGFLLRKFLWEG